MPSTRTRLALTLSDELREALFGLAEVMGKPAATVAGELLEQMRPQMDSLAKIVRARQAGNQKAAEKVLQGLLGDVLSQAEAHNVVRLPKAKK